jgi:hypothetical protein
MRASDAVHKFTGHEQRTGRVCVLYILSLKCSPLSRISVLLTKSSSYSIQWTAILNSYERYLINCNTHTLALVQ